MAQVLITKIQNVKHIYIQYNLRPLYYSTGICYKIIVFGVKQMLTAFFFICKIYVIKIASLVYRRLYVYYFILVDLLSPGQLGSYVEPFPSCMSSKLIGIDEDEDIDFNHFQAKI